MITRQQTTSSGLPACVSVEAFDRYFKAFLLKDAERKGIKGAAESIEAGLEPEAHARMVDRLPAVIAKIEEEFGLIIGPKQFRLETKLICQGALRYVPLPLRPLVSIVGVSRGGVPESAYTLRGSSIYLPAKAIPGPIEVDFLAGWDRLPCLVYDMLVIGSIDWLEHPEKMTLLDVPEVASHAHVYASEHGIRGTAWQL